MTKKPRTARKQAPKRFPLNMRTTQEIRDALEKAASKSGRSLAQEVEFRLEQSFHDQRLFEQAMELAYGKRLSAILMILGRVMRDVGAASGLLSARTIEGATDWAFNPYAFDEVAKAVAEVVEAFRPDGEVSWPGGFQDLGRSFARGVLAAVSDPHRSGEVGEWAKPIRESLGELATKIKVSEGPIILPALTPRKL